jgi:hypothetical protein
MIINEQGRLMPVMDQFEDVSRRMAAMSPEQQRKAIAEAQAFCACPRCQSYGLGSKEAAELLFCVHGRSAHICGDQACACPKCSARNMMGIRHEHFCTRGNEKEQRGIR